MKTIDIYTQYRELIEEGSKEARSISWIEQNILKFAREEWISINELIKMYKEMWECGNILSPREFEMKIKKQR
jgi:hypothetical protein